jgi:two-component system, OmpR family, phosphate regulon sensor histidine kinase PhoR
LARDAPQRFSTRPGGVRPRTILAIIGVLSVPPAAGLAALVLFGAAGPAPVLLALVVAIAFQAGLALLWVRDLHRISATLAQAEGGPPRAFEPLVPGLAIVLDGADRRARGLADRARSAEAALRAEGAIFEGLPDPLLVLGADHRLRRASSAARREFGAQAAPVLRHPTLRAALDSARAGGPPQSVELLLPVPVPREWQANITALDPASGDSDDRFVVALADRTHERAVERMRADFVANASHELRTPLASLIGFIETLRGPAEGDAAATQRFLGIMAEQAARMERLIADLLSLSRIELQEHQRPEGPVDLAGLVARIAAELEPQIEARGAALRLDLAPELPKVPGDADQLAQVLQNLLDNALRHGRQAGGTVRLSAQLAGPGGAGWPHRPGVALSVADDGPGISREHIPRLTERFYRVDGGRSRAARGTGLGLAIVKHIVNRHRGQLRIESREGAGASFTVWLPRD